MGDEGADIGLKLNEILSDPDRMAKVMEMVRGFGGDEQGQTGTEEEPKTDASKQETTRHKNEAFDMSKLLTSATAIQKNRSVALLQALRPFLSKARQDRADQVLKIIRLAEIAGQLQDFI